MRYKQWHEKQFKVAENSRKQPMKPHVKRQAVGE